MPSLFELLSKEENITMHSLTLTRQGKIQAQVWVNSLKSASSLLDVGILGSITVQPLKCYMTSRKAFTLSGLLFIVTAPSYTLDSWKT